MITTKQILQDCHIKRKELACHRLALTTGIVELQKIRSNVTAEIEGLDKKIEQLEKKQQ